MPPKDAMARKGSSSNLGIVGGGIAVLLLFGLIWPKEDEAPVALEPKEVEGASSLADLTKFTSTEEELSSQSETPPEPVVEKKPVQLSQLTRPNEPEGNETRSQAEKNPPVEPVSIPNAIDEAEDPKKEALAALIPTPSRKWANQDGETLLGVVTAVGLDADTVDFLRADGKVTEGFPIGQLSAIDQQYARGIGDGVLYGQVVGVYDGDSLTLLVGGNTQLKIRLESIDAPELSQEYSQESKKGLSELVFGKEVEVEVTGRDKYDRILGWVRIEGGNVNHEMVVRGLAWHFEEYSDSKSLASAELEARAEKRGLWAGFNPMSPWDYRDRLRQAAADRKVTEISNPEPSERRTFTSPTSATPKASPKTYWLNTSSYVRHNRGCRWYGNTKRGRSCGPSEGRACNICGG